MSVPTYYDIIISSNVSHLNPIFLFLVDNPIVWDLHIPLNWNDRARPVRPGPSSETQGPRNAGPRSLEFGVIVIADILCKLPMLPSVVV